MLLIVGCLLPDDAPGSGKKKKHRRAKSNLESRVGHNVMIRSVSLFLLGLIYFIYLFLFTLSDCYY